MKIMRPWWEPNHLPILEPSDYPILSPFLVPLFLLAPFTEKSTVTGNFPVGYYCSMCGRLNVQRFLRHRICEGALCNSREDAQRESGWATGPIYTRRSATVEDTWMAPTINKAAIAFDDGVCLFHFHLATTVHDSGLSVVSVRHVFNRNTELLQGDASLLFKILQCDIHIERSIGESVFSTPYIKSGEDPVLGHNGHSIWEQQAALIESALSTYCNDLGPLKAQVLRVQAWASPSKVCVFTLCPDRCSGCPLDSPVALSNVLSTN